MRVLIALGGKALPGGGDGTLRWKAGAAALAGVAEAHEPVFSHGNRAPAGPLGAGGGGIGCMLELALRNALPGRDLATVLSTVVVGAGDPALEPQAIVGLRNLRTLIDAGALVICADSGIAVSLDGDGAMRGIEAAVDSDLTAALLARRLDADALVLLTDVDAVRLDWRGEAERALGTVAPAELRRHEFAAGSIGPKVDAACRFVEATGRRAAIGELTKAVEIVRGEAGTQILAPSA